MTDWQKEAWIVHRMLCKERVGTEADVRFCALALAGEVGELCNLVKKQWRAEWGYPPDDPARLRREMADEIADSMVYLYLLARTLGFDLDTITADKWDRVKPRYGLDVQSALAATECRVPPPGWRCTRAPGHEGPCAAVPTEDAR